MTQLTIQVQDQAVRSALAALAQRLGNVQPVLQDIGEDVVQRTKARFTAQAGPDGQAWKPKKKPNGKPILVERGLLRRGIVWAVAANSLTVQATQVYAAIHQFGGRIERKAGQVTVAHRTNAKGQLMRSAVLNGKGLIFAKTKGKGAHKNALSRSFASRAHTITMPARPFMPVRADGTLYLAEQQHILAAIAAWLEQGLPS